MASGWTWDELSSSQLQEDQSCAQGEQAAHQRDHEKHAPRAAGRVAKTHATSYFWRNRPPRRLPRFQVFSPNSPRQPPIRAPRRKRSGGQFSHELDGFVPDKEREAQLRTGTPAYEPVHGYRDSATGPSRAAFPMSDDASLRENRNLDPRPQEGVAPQANRGSLAREHFPRLTGACLRLSDFDERRGRHVYSRNRDRGLEQRDGEGRGTKHQSNSDDESEARVDHGTRRRASNCVSIARTMACASTPVNVRTALGREP
jgi:hypothetical protein